MDAQAFLIGFPALALLSFGLVFILTRWAKRGGRQLNRGLGCIVALLVLPGALSGLASIMFVITEWKTILPELPFLLSFGDYAREARSVDGSSAPPLSRGNNTQVGSKSIIVDSRGLHEAHFRLPEELRARWPSEVGTIVQCDEGEHGSTITRYGWFSRQTGKYLGPAGEEVNDVAGPPIVTIVDRKTHVALAREQFTQGTRPEEIAAYVAGLLKRMATARLTDTTAPTISGMPSQGCTFPPPQPGELNDVASVSADDPSGITFFNVIVTSNEPPRSGFLQVFVPTPPEISVIGTGVKPRQLFFTTAYRSSGINRTYTIFATATDLAGNTATAMATCTVALSRDKARPSRDSDLEELDSLHKFYGSPSAQPKEGTPK